MALQVATSAIDDDGSEQIDFEIIHMVPHWRAAAVSKRLFAQTSKLIAQVRSVLCRVFSETTLNLSLDLYLNAVQCSAALLKKL